MIEQTKLNTTDKKEIMRKIDDFLYYLEDNFGIMHEAELTRLGIDVAIDKLNNAYLTLEEEVKGESANGNNDLLDDLHLEQREQM